MRWFALVCLTAAGLAQSSPGTISGKVLDQDQAVAGAPMQARNVQTGTIYTATSSANGSYSIEHLPPGKYEVTIKVDGFEKKEATVEAGKGCFWIFVSSRTFSWARWETEIFTAVSRV
jgi:hypothetical protein